MGRTIRRGMSPGMLFAASAICVGSALAMRLTPAQAGMANPAALARATQQQFQGASSVKVQGTIHHSIEVQVKRARREHLHHLVVEHRRYLAHLLAQREAAAAARKRQEQQSPPAPVSDVPIGSLQAYAAQLAGSQFSCVDAIFTRESGWRWNAYNPSGAYGIPQALPGSKMASAGADWQTNPYTQIRWGIGYMNSVYGSPCAAWGHWQATGSY